MYIFSIKKHIIHDFGAENVRPTPSPPTVHAPEFHVFFQ